jgi:predicted DNA repair protein MutK
MATAGLLSLLDDLATVLDDVAVMAKLATKKTAALAGDDLAVGAQAMVGLHPTRELPIVWAVTKGSLINKLWLVPLVLVLTLVAPWSLTPLLMMGGAFLCYEGVHKSMEKLHIGDHALAAATLDTTPVDPVELEKQKVRGAVRTDVILSAEIVVIALNAISERNPSFAMKALTLSIVAFGLTIVIYGLIALIVKADDVGLHLVERGGPGRPVGKVILKVMPVFMKVLGVLGTVAMFMVGGEIIAHGLPGLDHHWLEHLVEGVTMTEPWLTILTTLAVIIFGMICGAIVVGLKMLFGPVVKKIVARFKKAPAAS